MKNKCGQKLLGGSIIVIIAMFLLSCVAAIPAVVVYYKNERGFVVTAQVDVNADKVYQAALNRIDSHPDVKLVEKDDQKRSVSAEAMRDGKKHEGSLTVTPIDANRSQLVAIGDLPGHDEEAEKHLAIQIIKNICDDLGVKYRVVEG